MACFFPQETSTTRLSYVKEVDCAIPGTPALRELRKTSWEVTPAVDTVVSDEINSERQIVDRIPVGGTTSGPMAFEFSYAEYEDFMAGALQSSWTDITQTVADLSVTSTTVFTRATGDFLADGIPATGGVWIKTSGFTNPENNGYFKVNSATALTLTVEGETSATPLVVEAQGSRDYKASFMFNDSTKSTFYFEMFFDKVAKHFAYNNIEVNNMNLDFASNSLITGSFDFLGSLFEPDLSATRDDDSTIDPSTTNEILNTTSNLSSIRLGGSALTTTFAQTLTLATTNNQATRQAIGSFYGVGNLSGNFDATGAFTLYFKSNQPLVDFLANQASTLDWRVQDSAGNAYIFDILSFKYTDVPVTVPGPNADVLLEASWGAVKDATTGKSMCINRFSA